MPPRRMGGSMLQFVDVFSFNFPLCRVDSFLSRALIWELFFFIRYSFVFSWVVYGAFVSW